MTRTSTSRRDTDRTALEGVAKTPPAAPEHAAPATTEALIRKTKAVHLCDMLAQPGGASLLSLSAALGWKPHTIRAALSGLRKAGVEITRISGEDGSIYGIAPAAPTVDPLRPGSKRRTRSRKTPDAAVTSAETEADRLVAAGLSDAAAEPLSNGPDDKTDGAVALSRGRVAP